MSHPDTKLSLRIRNRAATECASAVKGPLARPIRTWGAAPIARDTQGRMRENAARNAYASAVVDYLRGY